MSKQTYRNLASIPTWKLQEIVDSHHCTGIDGADYHPVREELESELWRRNELDSQRDLKQFELNQKEQFKATYKRAKA